MGKIGMLCLVALVIFGILGIFSLTYRRLANEALNCVWNHLRLRPCQTSFDLRVKSKIVSWLLNKSPKWAKFVNITWPILSWLFTILFFASLIYIFVGIANFILYGTCTPANPQNCIIKLK